MPSIKSGLVFVFNLIFSQRCMVECSMRRMSQINCFPFSLPGSSGEKVP